MLYAVAVLKVLLVAVSEYDELYAKRDVVGPLIVHLDPVVVAAEA
jgi:hypothetical protein